MIQRVQYILESTSLIDSDGTFTYSWSVGESLLGEGDLSSSTTHTISSSGTYNVGLTVITIQKVSVVLIN